MLSHPFRQIALAAVWATLMLCDVGPAQAENNAYPDAIESDPARLGWMVGSPPPPDRILRFDDGSYFRFPAMRWSVSHFRQLMPTVNVSRGTAAPGRLRQALRDDIDALMFMPMGSDQPMSWRESLLENYTDGIIVLHKGRVVYERGKSRTRTNWAISYSDPINKLTSVLAGPGYGGNSTSKERCRDPIPHIPDIPG